MDRDVVLHTAKLARLDLDLLQEDEVARLAEDLRAIVAHVESLQALDLDGVPPTQHPVPLALKLVADEPTAPLPQETLLQNAAAVEDGFVRVPRVVGAASQGDEDGE